MSAIFEKAKIMMSVSMVFLCMAVLGQVTDSKTEKAQLKQVYQYSTVRLKNYEAAFTFGSKEMAGNWELDGWKQKRSSVTTGSYAFNAEMQMTSTPIAVPELADGGVACIEITEWFSLEYDYDFGYVYISDDKGNTWKRLYSVTGLSEPRIKRALVSQYSGKEILLKFVLEFDGSFEFDGWSIEKVRLIAGEYFDGDSPRLKGDGSGDMISITSVHDQNFPDAIFVNFEYFKDGEFVDDLTLKDIHILEDGLPQNDNDCRRLWKGVDQTAKRAIDIVFLIDNSGSMREEQQAVIASIKAMTKELSDLNQGVRFAYLRFGQDDDDGAAIKETVSNASGLFTGDPDEFSAALDALSTVDGYIEQGYDALVEASKYNFRSSAEKAFIIITDENTTDPQNMGTYSLAQTIQEMNAINARVFGILPTVAEYNATYGAIVDATKGERYDIESDFSDLLVNKFTARITQKYILRYCPNDKETMGVEREVEILLTEDASVSSTGSYTPLKETEYIVRDSKTQGLDSIKAHANAPLTIGVYVKDHYEDYPAEVLLKYRRLDSEDDYTAIIMMPSDTTEYPNKHFSSIIPADDVQYPGLEYIAEAVYADGSTITTPAAESEFFAWTVAVEPNDPPVIILNENSLPQLERNKNYPVEFTVSDKTDYVDEVTFSFREINSNSAYTDIVFNKKEIEDSENVLTAIIPESYIAGEGIEFFIWAKDNHGALGHKAYEDDPIQLFLDPLYMWAEIQNFNVECFGPEAGDRVVFYSKDDSGTLVECGTYTYEEDIESPVNGPTEIIKIKGDESSSAQAKNGASEGEELTIMLIRDGVSYELHASKPKPFVYNSAPDQDDAVTAMNVSDGNEGIVLYADNNESNPIENGDQANSTTKTLFEKESFFPTSQVYKIENNGCGDIEISDIQISNTIDFALGAFTPGEILSIGQIKEFTISFTSRASTAETQVSILSDNPASPYVFNVLGHYTAQTFNLMAKAVPNSFQPWGGHVVFNLPLGKHGVTITLVHSNGLSTRYGPYDIWSGEGTEHRIWTDTFGMPSGAYEVFIETDTGHNSNFSLLIEE